MFMSLSRKPEKAVSSATTAMAGKDKDKDRKGDLLSVGTIVEVSSDDEGFKGAWYVATIVKSPSPSRTPNSKRKSKALVKYHSLVSDLDETQPLTEYIDTAFIRPLPPKTEIGRSFEQYDVVDAFHRDGWWKGVVIKVDVLKDESDSTKYTVIFENPPEQCEFGYRDLRLHCDWIKGKWVQPPKQKRMEGLKFSKGMAVEVNLNKENLQDAWFPAIVIEEVGFNSFLVECSSSSNDAEDGHMKETVDCFHIRAPPPNLEVQKFCILETVDAFHDSSWRDGLITKILTEGRYNVYMKHANKEKQLSISDIRPQLHLRNGTWVSYSRDTLTGLPIEEQSTIADNNAKNTEVAIQIESSIAAKDCSEEKALCKNTKKNQVEQSTPAKSKNTKKNQVEHSTPAKAKNTNKNQEEQSTPYNAKSISKKGKKRTPKSEDTLSCPSKKFRMEKSANPSPSQPHHAKLLPTETTNQEVQVTDGTLTKCSTKCLVESQPSAGSETAFRGKNIEPDLHEAGLEKEMTGSTAKREIQLNSQSTSQWIPGAGGEDKTKGQSAEVIVEVEHIKKYDDSSAALAEGRRVSRAENSFQLSDKEINMQKESDVIGQQKGEKHNVAGGSASEMDFEDSATKMAELSSVTDMEPEGALVKIDVFVSSANNMAKEVSAAAVRASYDSTNASQALSGVGERHFESLTQSSAINVPVDNEMVESHGMPFVKCSSIWKNIESLEVFQFLPQKPHFGPLIDCKVASREGFAIGHMLTFATVVEKTSKLQVGDPRNLFDSYLETLADLEMLGFDVKAVVDRLNKLLSIKDRREQLQGQSKDVLIHIEECTHEKTKLREEIDEIDKMITELEERRAMKVSMKVMKESEITALQVDVNGIYEDISNAKHEFESLAASPW